MYCIESIHSNDLLLQLDQVKQIWKDKNVRFNYFNEMRCCYTKACYSNIHLKHECKERKRIISTIQMPVFGNSAYLIMYRIVDEKPYVLFVRCCDGKDFKFELPGGLSDTVHQSSVQTALKESIKTIFDTSNNEVLNKATQILEQQELEHVATISSFHNYEKFSPISCLKASRSQLISYYCMFISEEVYNQLSSINSTIRSFNTFGSIWIELDFLRESSLNCWNLLVCKRRQISKRSHERLNEMMKQKFQATYENQYPLLFEMNIYYAIYLFLIESRLRLNGLRCHSPSSFVEQTN
jgi:hypothetical protein